MTSGGPKVVALGGGHGTAVTLRAVRTYAASITAVVSVADDGGSSGRLRSLFDVVALGDLRRCLVALATGPSSLIELFQHRYRAGELDGHSLGNLVLAGLIETQGGLLEGLAEAASLLGCVGTVLPATIEPVVLTAETEHGPVCGQFAITNSNDIKSVMLDPPNCVSPQAALEAINEADQIIIGPGSLFTSVLAAVSAREIRTAIGAASGQVIFCCNLEPQIPETGHLTIGEHVDALVAHGITPDLVLCDTTAGLALGDCSATLVDRPLADQRGHLHDSGRLAEVLSSLA